MGCLPSRNYENHQTTTATATTPFLPRTKSFFRRLSSRKATIPSQPLLPSPSDSSHRAQKLRRLQSPGVVVLIDASNLETEGQKLAWELAHGRAGRDESWRIRYDHLLTLIAKRGDLASTTKPRDIIDAHCISSERHLVRNRFVPGRKTWARLGITFTIPSSRNFVPPRQHPRHRPPVNSSPQRTEPSDSSYTRAEKAVDHTLVRIMTQEFEGLQLLYPNRQDRPRRTIALVAGDFDYVDVVEQARLSGCNVEMWYWTGRTSMSTQWIREESKRHDALGTLSFYDLRDHFEFLTTHDEISGDELPGDRPDRLSLNSERSIPEAAMRLGGETGQRRFSNLRSEQNQEHAQPPTSEVRRLTPVGPSVPWKDGGPPSPFTLSVSSPAPHLHSPMKPSFSQPGESAVPRCSFREFCNQEGCELWHTEAERRHFDLYHGKGRYRLAKTKVCKGGKLCKANAKRYGLCPFLHEEEQPLCVQCLLIHPERPCDVERVRPINALEARPLVKKGYLVDLLMVKSSVGQPSSSRSTSRTSGTSDSTSFRTDSISIAGNRKTPQSSAGSNDVSMSSAP